MSDYSKRERDGYMSGLFKSWRKMGWSIVRTSDLKLLVGFCEQADPPENTRAAMHRLIKEIGND